MRGKRPGFLTAAAWWTWCIITIPSCEALNRCPASHPYVYHYGDRCCEVPFESSDNTGQGCDGSILTRSGSSCCGHQGEGVLNPCPGYNCYNYELCDTFPNGYRLLRGKYYKYHTTKVDHGTASDTCASENAQLATFKNQEDYRALMALKEAHGNLGTWVGLINPGGIKCKNAGCDGDISWVDGGTFSFETFMGTVVTDDNPVGSPCIRREGGLFNDRPCATTYAFLCQYACPSPCEEAPNDSAWDDVAPLVEPALNGTPFVPVDPGAEVGWV